MQRSIQIKSLQLRLRTRNQQGNILLLILMCVALIVVPLIILACQGGLYSIDRDRAKNAVEAAALLAANDLSRIIIDDDQFGYVSLSNFPANGEGTMAQDGEPLPVTSINTLMGTIRQLAILGSEIQNQTISELAEDDRKSLESTVTDLNDALSAAVKTEAGIGEKSKSIQARSDNNSQHSIHEIPKDNHGQKVEIAKDVGEFLQAHLPASLKLESIEIETGWLKNSGNSSIPLPSPVALAKVEKGQVADQGYRAFVDIPFHQKSYTFAGLGKSTSLVNINDFRDADDDHINSIIKVKATFKRNNQIKNAVSFGVETPDRIAIAAAAQPYILDESGPAGVMTLRFSGGSVTGLHTWSEFLQTNNFHDRQIMTYQPLRGDYPVDPLTIMRPSKLDSADGTAQQFAEHLYYWLRNGHLRPSMGSIIEMLSQRFQSGPNDIYAYEFSNNGTIARRIIARDPFPIGFTAENQVSTTIDTCTTAGATPIIMFHNNVKRLGKKTGGKHAGQPIAGNPLNWCELAEYGGDDFIANAMRKGKLATGMALANPTDAHSSFRTLDGKLIVLQPRKSSYSGGLAVDIEIGGLNIKQAGVDAQTISLIKNARGAYAPPR